MIRAFTEGKHTKNNGDAALGQPKSAHCRYEGTYEVNALVAGRGVTGLAAFKPPPGRTAPVKTAEGMHG